MKKEFKILFIIVTWIGLTSCGNKVERVYYPNGQLKFVGKVINDLPDGLCTTYYENGQIMQISNWKEGKMNGLRRYYYKNGELKEKSVWKDDNLNGWATFYSSDGGLEMVGKYKNGKGIGWFKYYDSKGNLSNMTEFYIQEGKSLVNQEINFDEKGKIIKEKSNYFSIKPNLDTLIQNKEYYFKIQVEGSLYKQNMRVILNECSSLSTFKSDTINGEGLWATVRINPKSKGLFRVCGKVQEYTNPIVTPRGYSYKSRDIFFEKEFVVK